MPNLTWIDIEDPHDEDVEYLRSHFDFHPLVLGEIIPPGWRPKVESYDTYLFLVVYAHHFDAKSGDTIPQELDAIITKNTVITSHYFKIEPLDAIFEKCQSDARSGNLYAKDSVTLFYFILKKLWESILKELHELEGGLNRVEAGIFNGKEKAMVPLISGIKREIIDLRRIVLPQKQVLESLQNEGKKFFGDYFSPFMNDILGTFGKAENVLQEYKETIEAMEKTNESLLTTKTNETIQILTVIATITFPLSLFISLWGMNTTFLPFVGKPSDFWKIIGLTTLLAVVMAGMIFLYFKRKKLL